MNVPATADCLAGLVFSVIVSLNETPCPAIRADAALKPSVFELFARRVVFPMKIVQKVKVPLQR
jgi:hypothetical protein